MKALVARARQAVTWLGTRPEKELVVVSHSAFLMHLFGFGHPAARKSLRNQPPCFVYDDQQVGLWMISVFANAEMRTVVARFGDGSIDE
jgi:hypothetical protein